MSKQYQELKSYCDEHEATLVAVSKTKPTTAISAMYELGQRVFGENRVQELTDKHEQLPKDIQWHMIGHLQTNKVKQITPFIDMIHSGDRISVLKEVNKQAAKQNRIIDILLQVKIAEEDSKYGWDADVLLKNLHNERIQCYPNLRVRGLMGMATFTDDATQLRSEFYKLKTLFDKISSLYYQDYKSFDTLSMGMSGDYEIAIETGSTMIRVGSLLFGER